MKYEQDTYWNQVSSRNPGQSSERSWKCLCCEDTGIVSTVVLNQYYPADRDPSDIASRCQRAGCSEGAKYPGYALNRDVSPEVCQWLHEQEASAKAAPPDQAAVFAKVKEGLERIANAFPGERDRNLANDPILRADPDSAQYRDDADW